MCNQHYEPPADGYIARMLEEARRPEAPSGYRYKIENGRAIRRQPVFGEWFLCESACSLGEAIQCICDLDPPRWILEKLPTVEEVYGMDRETVAEKLPRNKELSGEFRPPKYGETYISAGYNFCTPLIACEDFKPQDFRLIVRDKPAKAEMLARGMGMNGYVIKPKTRKLEGYLLAVRGLPGCTRFRHSMPTKEYCKAFAAGRPYVIVPISLDIEFPPEGEEKNG